MAAGGREKSWKIAQGIEAKRAGSRSLVLSLLSHKRTNAYLVLLRGEPGGGV